MGRISFKTAEEKMAVIRSVLHGEITQVEAGPPTAMSQATIAKEQPFR